MSHRKSFSLSEPQVHTATGIKILVLLILLDGYKDQVKIMWKYYLSIKIIFYINTITGGAGGGPEFNTDNVLKWRYC